VECLPSANAENFLFKSKVVVVNQHKQGEINMIRSAIMFFVLGLVAMLLGAYNVAGVSMEIGRILLGVFLVLAVLSFLGHLITGRSNKALI
jgi:uncharacterized membrane protein YtjA (UPF0391 family)